MRLILTFSGEHPLLPYAEFEAVLGGEGISRETLLEDGRILVFDAVTEDSSFLKRLALTKVCGFYAGSVDDLNDVAERIHKLIKPNESFRVRCSSTRLERKLGKKIHELGHKVKLKNPDQEVFIVKDYVGLKIPLERDFNSRKPQYRPFFHPTSMHPKIARVLVNLACVKRGDLILDPFCGTGGILIEAALMGMRVFGCDVDEKMVEGCKINLKHFGLSGDVKKEDALSCVVAADAIVTDPPYGRSSYVSEKQPLRLYRNFIKHAAEILAPKKYMILVSPKEYKLDFTGFNVKEYFDLRMHKSLTRRIWVLEKV